jgi:type IV pilus assembly protein PilC
MKLSLQDRSQFTRQLATLVSAGLPLLQALETVAKSTHKPVMQQLIAQLCVALEQGVAFHLALRQAQGFDALYCALVGAAEMAGNLDVVLLRLSLLLEARQQLHTQIRSALSYPCVVVCITCVVVAVIMVWVVPVFEGIFASLGAELPALTQTVLQLSRWLTQGSGILSLLAVLVLFGMLSHGLRQQAWFQLWWDSRVLRLPLLGTLVHQSQLAVWTQMLSDLLKAGVPMLEALEVVAASSSNRCLGIATLAVRTRISHGVSLADALQSLSADTELAHVFPPVLIQLVAVGEQSGALDALLGKLADQTKQQVDKLLLDFTQLLEPTMMVVLGLIMGGLVVALYLPVFQLGQVL